MRHDNQPKTCTLLHRKKANPIMSIENKNSRATWDLAAVISHDLERDDAIRRQRCNLFCSKTVLRRFGDEMPVNRHEFSKGTTLQTQ